MLVYRRVQPTILAWIPPNKSPNFCCSISQHINNPKRGPNKSAKNPLGEILAVPPGFATSKMYPLVI